MTSAPRELLVIADASPLILLAKIGRLELLVALADQVWVPAAVWREVVSRGEGRPEVAEIVTRFASGVREADPERQVVFALQVNAGETAALALGGGEPARAPADRRRPWAPTGGGERPPPPRHAGSPSARQTPRLDRRGCTGVGGLA